MIAGRGSGDAQRGGEQLAGRQWRERGETAGEGVEHAVLVSGGPSRNEFQDLSGGWAGAVWAFVVQALGAAALRQRANRRRRCGCCAPARGAAPRQRQGPPKIHHAPAVGRPRRRLHAARRRHTSGDNGRTGRRENGWSSLALCVCARRHRAARPATQRRSRAGWPQFTRPSRLPQRAAAEAGAALEQNSHGTGLPA